ncbi:UDP-glycosyltransferase 73B1 [Striga hermonthica]|uniref:Glycosyltransferase n=1 Tax=Striga hermonthica TaxID=68872 RepID=A0A9N7MP86_STRHE|nr:UDP-glycosyltransferase 73B1 [Striga hermonthica]
MSHAVQDLAALPNVELFIFRSISAFSVASWEPDILPQLPLRRHVIDGVPSLDGYYPPSFAQFLALQTAARTAFSGEIYNSCREIEGFALDPLEGRMRREGKRFFAAGPFNPVGGEFGSGPRHRCLDWLDRQAAGTVVLVSFGTTCSFTEEQVGEVAKGLERSGQSFVWVVREADRADIFAAPAAEGGSFGRRKNGWEEGFEERVRDRGILVRDWAPQLQILAHPSTGGFVSHCGWNSCLESISMGVPMATWAQHSDQPANAALITKVLNVGIEIKKWTREDELVSSRTIEMAVRELMSSSDIRKNAAELGKIVRRSVMEGGTSRKEMDACRIAAVHNRQALARDHGFDPTSAPNIHFHNFPIPPDLEIPDPDLDGSGGRKRPENSIQLGRDFHHVSGGGGLLRRFMGQVENLGWALSPFKLETVRLKFIVQPEQMKAAFVDWKQVKYWAPWSKQHSQLTGP